MATGEYNSVLKFLAKFLGLYVVLNVAYGLIIEFYSPGYDPFTWLVTQHVVFFLSQIDSTVSMLALPVSASIKVLKDSKTVISVYEGCNSINVMIVYVSFLFSFTGPLKKTLQFFVLGIVVIYVMNLLRVILLYEVALFFPHNLYFFHKYFFTGIIYAVVFLLWYIWIKQVTKRESGTAATQG